MTRCTTLIFSLALGACSTATPEPRIEYRQVPVPVAVGCVSEKGRPEPPKTLKQRYTREQWAAMPPGAKARAVQAQAGERLNYEDADRAATSGCK